MIWGDEQGSASYGEVFGCLWGWLSWMMSLGDVFGDDLGDVFTNIFRKYLGDLGEGVFGNVRAVVLGDGDDFADVLGDDLGMWWDGAGWVGVGWGGAKDLGGISVLKGGLRGCLQRVSLSLSLEGILGDICVCLWGCRWGRHRRCFFWGCLVCGNVCVGVVGRAKLIVKQPLLPILIKKKRLAATHCGTLHDCLSLRLQSLSPAGLCSPTARHKATSSGGLP